MRFAGVLEPLAATLLLAQASITALLLIAGVGLRGLGPPLLLPGAWIPALRLLGGGALGGLAPPLLLALAATALIGAFVPPRRSWQEASEGLQRVVAALHAQRGGRRNAFVFAVLAVTGLAL